MASAIRRDGTVTAAQPVPESWRFLDGVNYTVRIDSKIRGKAKTNTEVTVFSENSPRFFAMYVAASNTFFICSPSTAATKSITLLAIRTRQPTILPRPNSRGRLPAGASKFAGLSVCLGEGFRTRGTPHFLSG